METEHMKKFGCLIRVNMSLHLLFEIMNEVFFLQNESLP